MEVFTTVKNGFAMTLEEDKILLRLAALLCEQFLLIREWRCPDIDQVLSRGDHFFSLHSEAVKCQAKMLPCVLLCYIQLIDDTLEIRLAKVSWVS